MTRRRPAAALIALALGAFAAPARAAPCDGDFGQATASPCATAGDPYCDVGGACRRCTGNGDCTSRPTRPICNLTTGACGATCATDTDCASTQYCPAAGYTCTAKLANGSPIPSPPGPCTVVVGFRACVSGVCDVGDNLCGLKRAAACSTTDQCRFGPCFAADLRCGIPDGEACADPSACRSGHCAGGKCTTCTRDSDCGDIASGRVCAAPGYTCLPGCRGSVGNHCPAGFRCTSNDTSIGECAPVRADAGPAPSADASDDATAGAPDAAPAVGAEGPPFDDGYMGGHVACSSAAPGLAECGVGATFGAVAIFGVARARRRRRG